MALCKVMIIGNLGADPEMRYTPSGRPVTQFNVAVNQSTKNQFTAAPAGAPAGASAGGSNRGNGRGNGGGNAGGGGGGNFDEGELDDLPF